MTAVHSVKCDTCGKLEEGIQPVGWVRVEERIKDSVSPLRWDFCSHGCLSAHAGGAGVDVVPPPAPVLFRELRPA